MKTFMILAMLAAPLATQDKQQQNTDPPQTAKQSASGQESQTKVPSADQNLQNVVKPIAKPAQPHQLITFTAEQLDEYENKILDRAEAFYNNRMTHLLWTIGVLMAIGGAIVGILIPMILEWQRKRSFNKELNTQSKKFNETLSKADATLQKFTEEQIQKLRIELISQIDDSTKAIYSNFSMIYTGLGGLLSSQGSPAGYSLMLQAHVLAMKFSIIGQRSGGCFTASQIIQLLSPPQIASEITLDILKAVDAEIESMKEELSKIVDDKKRIDMESQVKELQIFVHALINKKQRAVEPPPPQAGT